MTAPQSRPCAPLPRPGTSTAPLVVITGGAGFIGSHLVDHFLAHGWRVRAVDDLSSGSRENLVAAGRSTQFSFYEGNCGDATLMRTVCAGASVVYHLAARVGVGRVIESALATIETNTGTTRSVAESALEAGAVLVFVSTSEVYGRNENVPFREDADLSIGPPTVGRWSYAASKVLDEHLLFALHRERGLKLTVARLFNTVGPRQSADQGMVLPAFIRAALQGTELVVHGDGEQRRCFTWVGDAVDALAALCCVESARGRVFNIGSTEETSIAELAQMVIAECGGSVRLVPYSSLGPSFADMRRRIPCIEAIGAAVGWRPLVGTREIVKRTADWWRGRD